MIKLKKTSKYILTTGALGLASIGIFAGCGNSGGSGSGKEDKALIIKTLNDAFNNGVENPTSQAMWVLDNNFNVNPHTFDAINNLTSEGKQTNSHTIDLKVSSVISDSINDLDDGSKIVEATVVINDEDAPVPTKDTFDYGQNFANNFIYNIGYLANKNGNIIGFTDVWNTFLSQFESFGDGLIKSDKRGKLIKFNNKYNGTGSFNPTKNPIPDINLNDVPLLDNRINKKTKISPVKDNGSDYLLSLGNAFYYAVEQYDTTHKDKKVGLLSDVKKRYGTEPDNFEL
ncbi:hypothetical protein [Mycoplasma sp. SG1]|uniref:hypothetical protein n=1 Tax=Mycoplasma sp. SG1 TaxID=2810348 RepID=UPI002025192F|nr:hypothetical protein [Mycoplasma sp. SG1]URM53033.1 hypothetical protein JRW51_01660 [Mycoplasma sp. SG1]